MRRRKMIIKFVLFVCQKIMLLYMLSYVLTVRFSQR